jgi:type IV pilus assembly protein PilB
MKNFGERIADLLIADGLLTQKQLGEVLESQKKQGGRLLKLLLERQFVSEVDMTVAMARCLSTPPVTLAKMHVPTEVVDLIPKEMGTTFKMVAVARLERSSTSRWPTRLTCWRSTISASCSRPWKSFRSSAPRRRSTIFFTTSSRQRRRGWTILKGVEVHDIELAKENRRRSISDKLVESSEEGPVIKLVNLMLMQAIKDRASDIHIEPFEKTVRLRYRVDGVLYDPVAPPKSLQSAITSRVKIMSNLDIAERGCRRTGDSASSFPVAKWTCAYHSCRRFTGKIVRRVLDKGNLSPSLDTLGLEADDLLKFKRAIARRTARHDLDDWPDRFRQDLHTLCRDDANQHPDVNIVTVE